MALKGVLYDSSTKGQEPVHHDVIEQLFCYDGFFVRSEESCNTDNWIRLLTTAARAFDEAFSEFIQYVKAL